MTHIEQPGDRFLPSPRTPGSFSPSPGPQGDGEAPSFWSVVALVRRHALFVAACTVVVAAGVAYLVLKERPRYRSTAAIQITDSRGALTGGLAGTGVVAPVGKSVDPLLTQVEVLRSRSVLGAVVDAEGLLRLRPRSADVPTDLLRDVQVAPEVDAGVIELRFTADEVVATAGGETARAAYGRPLHLGGVRFTVSERPGASRAEVAVLPREEAIQQLLSGLRAQVRHGTAVVDVSYTSLDPHHARRVVNAVIREFVAYDVFRAREESRRRREFLEQQLLQTDSMMRESQGALSAFRSKERLFSSSDRLAVEQTGLLEMGVRRAELDSDRRMYASLLNGLLRAQGGETAPTVRALMSSPGIASNPVVMQLYTQLVRYETARDSLVAGAWGRAQSNPDVERLESLSASSREALLEAVRSHLTALDARIAALDELKERSARDFQRLPDVEAVEARLILQLETVQGMANQLREQHQKARLAEAVETGQVQIVDLAAAPGQPVGSQKPIKLGLGVLLGLMLGTGGALLLEAANTSIRRKEEIETVLNLPGLAIIPQIGNGSSQTRRLRLPAPFANGNGRRTVGEETGELVTVSHLRSPGAEAYRMLRTNLIFSQAVQTLRMITVTSSVPSEGKTTTAANLAVAFAQQGMRVLIVDCDLRKARLHKVFGVPREPGFTQLVLGLAPAEEAIRSTAVENLFLLPSGILPPNPAELLGGEQARSTLEALSAKFDLVIIDTPPLHAAADAAILGTQVDGVLLVVRAGQTDRAAALHAVQQLNNVGARVIGAVLNDPDAKVSRYGGYYYYDYYGAEA